MPICSYPTCARMKIALTRGSLHGFGLSRCSTVSTIPATKKSYYYPTSDLVTGPDIIFFWVASMIMAGYEYQKKPPFRHVYFTGIVRDKLGRKMSKSLGNSPDPIADGEVWCRRCTYGHDACSSCRKRHSIR
jgi:valyl-tRNA synthetase